MTGSAAAATTAVHATNLEHCMRMPATAMRCIEHAVPYSHCFVSGVNPTEGAHACICMRLEVYMSAHVRTALLATCALCAGWKAVIGDTPAVMLISVNQQSFASGGDTWSFFGGSSCVPSVT